MKKFLLLFLFLNIANPAISAIESPKWEEFCPAAYVNAKFDNYEPKMSPLMSNAAKLSIIGTFSAQDDEKRVKEAAITNYWVQRREAFNKKIDDCNNVKDEIELAYKYLSIRQAEYNQNQIFLLERNQKKTEEMQDKILKNIEIIKRKTN